jgi:regulator of RNase E activity RraA
MSAAPLTLEILRQTAVATLATVLRQNGLRSVWMSGPRPLLAGQPRIAGPAFTLRFTPAREDITTPESLVGPHSPRGVLEQIPAGCVVVVDAMGSVEAGVFGDIICARMQLRGVAGVVTDGAIRDWAGMKRLEWPIWANGSAAPASPAKFHFADTQVAVACGGTTVLPGDIIVADDDGAIVVPSAMADAVAGLAREKERFEAWVFDRVREGERLEGLYPPNEQTKARFENAGRQ